MKKGQQEALSAVLLSGILIGVVGSVYFWGIPLIQKNKDSSLLETSEAFMAELDTKIKFVANNGGRDKIVIKVPGIVRFDGKMIEFFIETDGTVYAIDAPIDLGRTSSSNLKLDTTDPQNPIRYGTWGADDPVLFTVKSTELGDGHYSTSYTLDYIELRNDKNLKDYKIKLTGAESAGGIEKTVIIENQGYETATNNGRTLISSIVKISIV